MNSKDCAPGVSQNNRDTYWELNKVVSMLPSNKEFVYILSMSITSWEAEFKNNGLSNFVKEIPREYCV